MPGKSSLFLRPRFHAKEPVLHRTMVAVYRTGFHLSIYCIALASTLPLRMLSYTVLRMYIFGLTTEHARVALVDNKANVLLEGFMSIFLRRGTVEN